MPHFKKTAFITRKTITAIGITTLASSLCADSITLPTKNNFLESGENEMFYTYVDRNFEGKVSQPWTGGKYGFVRNKKRTEDGVICTKFHEGIDISPLTRDASGEPTDPIKAVAKGVIAYTNAKSANSSYGKYTVIEHNWSSGPVYSLYAHLSEAPTKAGQAVKQGQQIGVLGYTGVGLNSKRAHLHLELCLMLSTRFQTWYDLHYKSQNFHGNHSGINMVGVDFAAFYLAQKAKPNLTLPEFVKTIPVHYKVTLPRKADLEILTRSPWLSKGNLKAPSPSWEISFSNSGFPLSIQPSKRVTDKATITFIRPCKSDHENYTKGFVTGTGNRASLSQTGQRYIELLTGDF